MQQRVMDYLTLEDALCQLAEEAAELAQAALKYRRALTGSNPTPVTPEEARENLLEETADVLLCLKTAGVKINDRDGDGHVIGTTMRRKNARWIARLKGWDR